MRILASLAVTVFVVYLGLCAALFFRQRSLIYFPQPRALQVGTDMATMPVDGAQLVLTVRPQAGQNAMVYFGGNGEDVSSSLGELARAFPDHALYLMHYRGYGGSTGKPSETALIADGLALLDKVQSEHKNVVVIGRSLGSGVAVHVASLRQITRLILVTPYDSVQAVAAAQFPYFPVRWLLTDKFESWRYAEQVKAPTLVIAAEHDEVIPRVHTDALITHFQPGIATLQVIAASGHNTLSDRPEYQTLLRGAR